MKPGPRYQELCDIIPLRPLIDDVEYVAADEFCEVLRAKLLGEGLVPDELAYLEVLELIVTDYDDDSQCEITAFDPDDEICLECGDPMNTHADVEPEPDDLVEEIHNVLDEQREKLQEWDFVALCENLQTAIRQKLSELESGS